MLIVSTYRPAFSSFKVLQKAVSIQDQRHQQNLSEEFQSVFWTETALFRVTYHFRTTLDAVGSLHCAVLTWMLDCLPLRWTVPRVISVIGTLGHSKSMFFPVPLWCPSRVSAGTNAFLVIFARIYLAFFVLLCWWNGQPVPLLNLLIHNSTFFLLSDMTTVTKELDPSIDQIGDLRPSFQFSCLNFFSF